MVWSAAEPSGSTTLGRQSQSQATMWQGFAATYSMRVLPAVLPAAEGLFWSRVASSDPSGVSRSARFS